MTRQSNPAGSLSLIFKEELTKFQIDDSLLEELSQKPGVGFKAPRFKIFCLDRVFLVSYGILAWQVQCFPIYHISQGFKLARPPDRHPIFFETFDNLEPRQKLVLVNDHEPFNPAIVS